MWMWSPREGIAPKAAGDQTASRACHAANAVTATDRQIDELVYELYALTPDERALVESGCGVPGTGKAGAG